MAIVTRGENAKLLRYYLYENWDQKRFLELIPLKFKLVTRGKWMQSPMIKKKDILTMLKVIIYI